MLFQRPYISKSSGGACTSDPPNNSPPALALMTAPPPNKSNLVKALNNTQQLERASSLGTGNPKVAFELIVSYIKVV